jgi:hypothetical protein
MVGMFMRKFDVRSGLLLVAHFVGGDVDGGVFVVGMFVRTFVGKFDIHSGLLVVDHFVDGGDVDGGDFMVGMFVRNFDVCSGLLLVDHFGVRGNGHVVVYGGSGKRP